MANRSEQIKNLEDLRAKKVRLQRELEKGVSTPFDGLTNVIDRYASGRSNPLSLFDKSGGYDRNELMDESVKAVLTLVASTAVTRFKLGPVPKLLLTTGVAIATPYIVDKIQSAMRKKRA